MPASYRIDIDDDVQIDAVHHTTEGSDWIVFSHGFVSDKTGSYEKRCERAVREEYNAVRFDYRGCGDSDGAFVDQTLSSKITDLQSVLSQFEIESCVVFGSSFGAKVAFHTAIIDDRITAIVGRAPSTYNSSFDTVRDHVSEHGSFEYTPEHVVDQRFFDDLDTHPFSDVETAFSVPVAIFHGRADESVPVTNSLRAAENLNVDALVQTYTDEGHRFSREGEARMRDQLFAWLAHEPYPLVRRDARRRRSGRIFSCE